ncbi:hypothetical protein [Primorskyibacter flagellatus]|nr:hypothetical protein [Primorskyibacter flagellatus]
MRSIAVLFVIAWFVFAFFDLNFDRDVFRAYTASEVVDYDPDEGQPRLLPRAVMEYRVQQGGVVGRIGDSVSEYEDCTVFDRDNWSCKHSDESGTFGARQGEFFSRSNLDKFPHLDYLDEEETLSRFRYIMLQCRWDATGGIDAIFCLLRPFTT